VLIDGLASLDAGRIATPWPRRDLAPLATTNDPGTSPGSPLRLGSVSTGAHTAPIAARAGWRPRALIPDWSAPAWGAIGVTSVFIGLTCWWLTQDRSIPIYDAGYDLNTAIKYHNMLQSGNLLGPFNHTLVYPPLAFLVGASGAFIGGVNVSSPIIAENVVFVSLLTLGCYQTGRLLFGAWSGLLAVIFAVGSPLLIAQFHVFMLDAPEAGLVAVSMWLILASEDFSRTRVAGVAGLVLGCGLLVKAQFPLYVIGIVLAALAFGGWRNWRGLAVFAALAFIIGAPWYIDHFSNLSEIWRLAGVNAAPGNAPPILSTANLLWYFWNTLNSLLLAPLFLLVLGGSIWTIIALYRREEARALRLEFLAGGFIAWLAISLTVHHDIRYSMPLLPYLAVLGTGWIVHLPRAARLATAAVLVLAVAANTLGSTFGVGGQVEAKLLSPSTTDPLSNRIVLYSNQGALGVAGPRRDGDVPGLLRALHSSGVRVVNWSAKESSGPDFSSEGLKPLAMIAGLELGSRTLTLMGNPGNAVLVHDPVAIGAPAACTRLSDGTGVWVLRANPTFSGRRELFCPFPRPHYYPSL
jgi:4-amino-4-deoxy-L-arabinose transferase-like glycosyltransferase